MQSCNTSIIQIYSTIVSLYKATEAEKKQLGPRDAKICPTLKKLQKIYEKRYYCTVHFVSQEINAQHKSEN